MFPPHQPLEEVTKNEDLQRKRVRHQGEVSAAAAAMLSDNLPKQAQIRKPIPKQRPTLKRSVSLYGNCTSTSPDSESGGPPFGVARSSSFMEVRRSFDFENEEEDYVNRRVSPNSSRRDSFQTRLSPNSWDSDLSMSSLPEMVPISRALFPCEEEEEEEVPVAVFLTSSVTNHYYHPIVPVPQLSPVDSELMTQMVNLDVSTTTAASSGFRSVHPSPNLRPISTTYFETPTREQSMHQTCGSINLRPLMRSMTLSKTKVVVLDLDLTFITLHTKGKFSGDGINLADYVRPVFLCLLREVLDLGLPVGIATFSHQEELIKDMLLHILPLHVRINENVFVRGYRAADNDLPNHGKGKRIQIAHLLNCMNLVGLEPRDLLFVDDDIINIEQASEDGHRTVLFLPDERAEEFLFRCQSSLQG